MTNPNQDQIDYWNGEAGEKWVIHSDRLDAMLAPFAEQVLHEAALKDGDKVIDIGCGAGVLSIMAAAHGGSVTGVDVSKPMLALAKRRADASGADAKFMAADATNIMLPADHDVLISRFGVMFFDDPKAAFTNLRKAMKPGGRLAFACWQAPDKNAWAITPLMIAMPFLKTPPARPEPRTPGPFAFADPDYVSEILSGSGWSDIKIGSYETEVKMPGDAPEESAAFMLKMGPIGRLMSEQELDIVPIAAALTEHFKSIEDDKSELMLGSAVWLVTARA